MKTLSFTVTIATLLLLAGCATKQVSHTNSPTKELATIKIQKLNEPTLENFLKLQEQILQGNIQAVDNIAELSGLLYADIDYKKDEERVRSNLDIMRATFTPIGIQAGSGNAFAYDALYTPWKFQN
ncbi:MAG: YgdI/YgdR family lipoprotein [Opitutales bacterium]|jgi:hypothetical protein|nr:YgdI/YgdR family lipoprotein [Opitutales bacterium]MDP4642856.1 YgdI/YgdR family lipoprotein [Opitutales bacterium]MDP4776544.1 YgdI/YgdR family lipoprotein [Opitutales bacterium]MDP4882704.1 YgdI/YgdR family lipoprotein [Opitutales bacterium]MDP5079068.1 YgdI/YgdR family lipoprotein [Opitutales bacterium]